MILSCESLHFSGMVSFEYKMNSEKNCLLTGAFKSSSTSQKKK